MRSVQGGLFDEAEADVTLDDNSQIQARDEETVEVPAHRRKRGGRKPLPAELPRIEVLHDLAEQDKVCAKGNKRKLISEKTSEQLDVIPMQIQVIRHVRNHSSA